MEIQQARAFLAVARNGSVSRAALAIGRTQPTVTMAVHKLERELKTKLLERAGRGVRLTRAGEALARSLGPLIEQWDRVPSGVEESPGGPFRGPVRIGAGEAAILYLLPAPLRSFRKRHPVAELVIHHETADRVLDGLRDGSLDFGIRSLPGPPAEFDFHPFITRDRVLIAPPGHPALTRRPTPETLSSHAFVLPRKGSTTRSLIEGAFARAGLELRISVEAGGWEIVKRYVALGLGISVIPAFCLQPSDRPRLAFRPVPKLFGEEVYGIVTKRGRAPSPAASALISELPANSAVT
jgi:DNA-binding transcriptional LysR family regulator